MPFLMIVDDEENVRMALKDLLESAGHKVILAENADMAWKLLQNNKPDLILLDVLMPGMPAQRLEKQIKEDPELSSIKVIYVTVLQASNANQNKYFVQKPFSNEELLNKIGGLLKN